MNKEFFIRNREKMMEALEDNCIVLLFSGRAPHRSADGDYDFIPNKNFYYMTGTGIQDVIFLGVKNNNKVEETLFIEKPDTVREAWTGKMLNEDDAKALSGIDNIKYIGEFKSFLNKIITANDNVVLYLDIEQRQWDQPQDFVHNFAGEIKERFPFVMIKNIYNTISDLRMIKTEEEVSNLKKAISITYDGIKNMMNNSNEGIMEYQLQAYFEFSLKHSGVKRPAFNSIIAAGVNATVLHYDSNNCKAEDHSLVLCDLGAEYQYYSADITRTFPVSGKFTKRQKEIYNIVLEANLETIKAMKSGVPSKSLNETAKRVLSEGCKRIGLIKEDSELQKYYFHGVSHPLGLDTHDVGKREVNLKPGMVFTVEPGLYIAEEGIGIRIEDDVLITEDGCEVLSKDIIKTVEEIEKFMKR